MNATFQAWADRLLGRGEAAITVPVMDGALKPNKALDLAEVLAVVPGLDDLASDTETLWATAGPVLYRVDGSALTEVRRFVKPITAIAAAAAAGGELAVALGGDEIELIGGRNDGLRLTQVDGRPLSCVNAMTLDAKGTLYLTEGSSRWPLENWTHDLMTHGKSGRLSVWPSERGPARESCSDLAYPFGVLVQGSKVLLSESWRHRVIRYGEARPETILDELPGYPSRLCSAKGGGFWVTCFVCRTQLVEFVLRESAFRKRMMEEVDPRYWVAPRLASGRSFLEPLQGAGVKQMGVLKPWAPPHSYGLVIRVSDEGEILYSLHSRVDGTHHGITAAAEHGGHLYVASRGAGKLLRCPVGAPLACLPS